LINAYSHGIFPWYSKGQPILWWSPNPRMVLPPSAFKCHPSLRKTICTGLKSGRLKVTFDQAFDTVIEHCAQIHRPGQGGTWIVRDMVKAYQALHRAGVAHSVEVWIDDQLAGGLYGVHLGRMLFGESMFSLQTNASKIALAALVAYARHHDIALIDCQQNTQHLASLGAREIPRDAFLDTVKSAIQAPTAPWRFDSVYWDLVLNPTPQKP
jgi:leucyl/phenylalanyl-tRNA--protein transferase